MKLNEWLNNEIPNISKSLENINHSHFFIDKTIGFAGKETIYKILHQFRSSLFPGVYEKYPIDETKVNIIIGNNLRTAALELRDLIKKALVINTDIQDKSQNECEECKIKATDIVIKLINKFPDIRQNLQTDIEAAYNGDPAAVTTEEILLSYPSIEAITIHRISHELYKMAVPIIRELCPNILISEQESISTLEQKLVIISLSTTVQESSLVKHVQSVIMSNFIKALL